MRGLMMDTPLLVSEFIRHAADRHGGVARWWLPDDVVFVDGLPHTATGKIHKPRPREGYRDHVPPTARGLD